MTDSMRLGSTLPLIAAPMAGGPTTVELAAAAATAGAFPFLAGGYQTPDELAGQIHRLREVGAPFGVNLFVPTSNRLDEPAFRSYAAELQPEADAYGLRLNPEPVADDDHWSDKLALLLTDPVPVVSLTFALPAAADIARLQRAGSTVLATVTTPAEAAAAQEVGVDGLIVQGPNAGGHSATHDPARRIEPTSTADLTRRIQVAAALPVIATGGVDGPDALRALLETGAQGVAVGTLLLRSDEAGTSTTHRAALADPVFAETVITRAFTGRPARALRNGFVERHDATAPAAYPAVHHLTRALRQAAARAGDADRLHLWAGTGYRSATAQPVATIISNLAASL